MSFLDRFRNADHPRVAVLGLSGVPYDVMQAESLSALDALFGSGTSTGSVLPPDEHAVWPAVMAGANPGHTGVFGLVDREAGSYNTYVPQGGDVQVPRLWDHVEAAGHTATVVNVPVTNPPQKEVDQMVAGPLAPDEGRSAHPETVREYLLASDYRVDVDAELGPSGALEELQTDARATLDARFDAFERLTTDEDWSVFVGCVTAIDRASHFLYDQYDSGADDGALLADLYHHLDTRVQEFHSHLPEDVVVCVVGDHGFSPLDREVHCNRWLEATDWLSYDDADADSLADVATDTRAYALPQGRFYLNLEDRDPLGTVPADQYRAVRNDLRDRLLTFTTPDGDSVIQDVYACEDLYDGPHVGLGPDLLAVPTPGFDLVANFTGPGATFTDTPRTGMHTSTDVPLAIDHPDVDVADATPFDLAPTVLDLLDVPVPDGLSGQSRLTA